MNTLPMILWKHHLDRAPVDHLPHRSGSWRRLRIAFLQINPTCAACGSSRSVIPHHIIPFTVDPSLFLVIENLLPLCDPGGVDRGCHLRIGHLGSFTTWNPDAVDQARKSLHVIQSARGSSAIPLR